MSNTALAAALSSYYAESTKIKIGACTWAAYVMASATFGDQGDVHWASDIVAGTLMGWVIGHTVGKRSLGRSPHRTGIRQGFIPHS